VGTSFRGCPAAAAAKWNELDPFKEFLYFKVIPEKSRYSGHFLLRARDWKDSI